MIKLILLDVDGIVLGRKQGFNFPYPTETVTKYLSELCKNGMKISLCTGKTSFATKKLIEMMNLDNLHITDGGAVIFNPINNEIFDANTLPKESVQEILNKSEKKNPFWQIYTLDNKYVQKDVFPEALQEFGMSYEEVTNLNEIADKSLLVKLELLYTADEEEFYRDLFLQYVDELSVQWTEIPQLLPYKIVLITKNGVNKRSSVDKLLNHYKVDRSEVLALGDTMMDWDFMKGSGYVATLENAKDDVKTEIQNNNGFIGSHVDKDGLIEVIEYFKKDLQYNS